MKKIDLILKVTDQCNLRCKYCYNSNTGYKNDILPLKYFEKLLDLLCDEYDSINVIWHGGEPMSAGIEYYREAIKVEERFKFRQGIQVTNSIQTNGTLITKEFAEFFKKNGFKVGVSYDGIDNDKYRQKGAEALLGIERLRAAGMKPSTLAVVADDSYDLIANYRFFRDKNISMDFNYIFPEGAAKSLSGTGAKTFADKMTALFDYWLHDKEGVDVRTFSFYINMSLGGCARICSQSSCHGKYLCLCSDGSLKNCGRDSVSAYPFGNIKDVSSVKEIFRSEGALNLIKGSIERRKKCKESCELFSLCQGGCADCAIWENGLENIPEAQCIIFKTVYTHVKNTFRKIMEDNIPLSELNPALRNIFSSKFVRFEPALKDELAQSYIALWMKQ